MTLPVGLFHDVAKNVLIQEGGQKVDRLGAAGKGNLWFSWLIKCE